MEDKGKISAFQLAMITAAYVTSIRFLPTLAEYGFSCIFYYLLGMLVFLIPSALISAELATAWPYRGGIYVWVKKAFGGCWGFLAVWLQFLANILTIPTFLSFIAATFAYTFMPQLATNKYFLVGFILIVFWSVTFISLFGMQTASWINTFAIFIGVFIPLSLILFMGADWLITGKTSQIVISTTTFFPKSSQLDIKHLAFLAGILFSFIGVEIAGAHALDVKNVKKDFPKAIFITLIIVSLIGFGGLAIAIVVPQQQLSLVAGNMQAFTIFFTRFHVPWAIPLLALLITIGAIAALNSWVIGPSKGLFGAAIEGEIPPILTKMNKYGMPSNMLLLQALGFTIITMLFLFTRTVSSAYWLIMQIITILYLVMYLLFFLAAIILRYKQPNVIRPYTVPGGRMGMWIIAGFGLISTMFGIFISFFAPNQIKIEHLISREILLIIGIIIPITLGIVIYTLRKPHWALDDTS